ncbi:MAG: TetR/AcrR family transcriptional regulator [Cyclobacteriaceae bacterium]|nr:TetR/AcrR family transcriptional regulator [Cyclobacteriaceae bacterium]
MKKTKEKILAKSLTLFNEHGVDSVKIRDITTELGMHVGNLNYYFPTKNDILYALCMEFIYKVDKAIEKVLTKQAQGVLEQMYLQADIIFSVQLEYRFMFSKRYAEIISSLPSVQQHYQTTLKTRFTEWLGFHSLLVDHKLAYPNLVEESNSLSYVLNILAIFWQQEATIYMPNMTDDQKKKHALSVYFFTYKPYLTKSGLDELMPLLRKLDLYKEP